MRHAVGALELRQGAQRHLEDLPLHAELRQKVQIALFGSHPTWGAAVHCQGQLVQQDPHQSVLVQRPLVPHRLDLDFYHQGLAAGAGFQLGVHPLGLQQVAAVPGQTLHAVQVCAPGRDVPRGQVGDQFACHVITLPSRLRTRSDATLPSPL